MSEEDIFKEFESVKRMALQPGDTIVVKTINPVREEVAERIRQTIELRFPGHKCLVIDSGIDISVAGSPE